MSSHSSHIFMFPFRFDYLDNLDKENSEYAYYKNIEIDKRLSIRNLLEKLNSSHLWEYIEFNLEKVLKEKNYKYYNEFAYFYDYAREALYNLKKFAEDEFFTHEVSYYFEFKNLKFGEYIIKDRYKSCEYSLKIDGISLRIFATGIGILSFELENNNYPEFKDIKAINELGRRFYPQFLTAKGENPPFLPEYIKIKINGLEADEDFSLNKVVKNHNEIRVGKHILKILDESIFTQEFKKSDRYFIQPVLDDRMFVLSWYGDDEVSKRLKNIYPFSDGWYEYIFIDRDGNCTVQNKAMKEKLLKEATYDRWSNYLTLFGVSRYSFVALSDSSEFSKEHLQTHLRTMYFQMITLILANRASILRFSDEVSAVAQLENYEEENRLTKLYAKYLNFYNRLYFKEVTHQDQGIELYDTALKQMRIVEHIEKLDGKFTKLNDFVNLKQSGRESSAMNGLNVLAATLGLPALVIAFFSIGVFEFDKSWSSLAIVFTITVLSAVAGYMGIKKWIEFNTKSKG